MLAQQREISVSRKGERGGRVSNDAQASNAAPHIDPALPDSRLGHPSDGSRLTLAEAAPITDPGDAGRESGQKPAGTHKRRVALATDPSQDGAGEGHTHTDTQTVGATSAKVRKSRGKRSGVDQLVSVTHGIRVGPAPSSEIGRDAEGRVGQLISDAQIKGADAAAQIPSEGEGRVGHIRVVTLRGGADPVIIDEIREQWRRRQAWHRAEKSLTLQAKALCRRLAIDGDKDEADLIYRAAQGEGSHSMADVALAATFPLTEARDSVEQHRKKVESRLRKLAKQLPIAAWVEGIPGASLNSLAAIVGEAGDLTVYSNPAKLWKRMGLAVMPDGTRQRRVGGDEAVLHGYSPARRSVVWNIGGSLIGGMGRGPRLEPGQNVDAADGLSDFQRIFVRRLRYEAARDPVHARPVTKAGKESFSKHAAARAKRYVEKRFLLLLWREWRRAGSTASPIPIVPVATLLDVA